MQVYLVNIAIVVLIRTSYLLVRDRHALGRAPQRGNSTHIVLETLTPVWLLAECYVEHHDLANEIHSKSYLENEMKKDTTSDYLRRLADLYASGALNSIYSSKTAKNFTMFQGLTNKTDWLPLDFSGLQRFYIRERKAGYSMGKHKHNSASFRYILSGSIVVDGEQYSEGEWVFIPEGVEYDFATKKDAKFIIMCNQAWDDLPDDDGA